jgi:hypothetical protein
MTRISTTSYLVDGRFYLERVGGKVLHAAYVEARRKCISKTKNYTK